jgi:hypothetical protein
MFPLISSITQQQQPPKQPTNESTLRPPIKNPCILLQGVFYIQCKQGGRTTVLREGCDIGTREACVPISLNINNLEKAALLHFVLFCSWGHAKFSLLIIGLSCAYVKFS